MAMEPAISSSPMRVLIRPPTSSSTTSSVPQNPSFLRLSSLLSSSSSLESSSSLSSSSTLPAGVIVVGFIGRNSDDVTQLINRILDANVFGSGNLDKKFPSKFQDFPESEARDENTNFSWHRKLSYYHEEEKGIVFLHFSPCRSSLLDGMSDFRVSGEEMSLDSFVEENESEDLKGMLVMFSVCHIVLYLHGGSCFDTQILKKLRVLQAAKHALTPFVKSHITPTLTSKLPSSLVPTILPTSSKSPSRGSGVVSRHTSAVSLMSGPSSAHSLFPGHCTPVILFVFLDDFSDCPSPGSRVEDSNDHSLAKHNLTVSGISSKPTLSGKGSSSVVMLARPISKTEGSFKKKLQSSLEAQIRFLIKKCRILAGTEINHSGSRGGAHLSNSPLFYLDSSRAVALLDWSMNSKGESLNFAIGLVEEVLNSKAGSDILFLENHSQHTIKEDIQSIKEFIYRQSEMLRGRGGLATNSNSGSAAGVGMVAVAAAAAAAASAASGKSSSTPPELPSVDYWLSYTDRFLDFLVCNYGSLDENKSYKNARLVGKDAVKAAISLLESGRDLNMSFSTSWCQSALPAAKEVYLKDLPACYPTILHERQLEKAMRIFKSMVKGPAVQVFAKRLEEECTSIWKSGRQLCDAISLTGKPCMHQRHNLGIGGRSEVKSHSSGYVFLHACACGRSRKFQDDPFDFDSANIKFNCLPNCENLLPALQLPKISNAGPVQASSWSLIRVGGAKYYEPSKGILQTGFCSTEKFLFRWMILLEKQKVLNGLLKSVTPKGSTVKSSPDLGVLLVSSNEIKNTRSGEVEDQRKPSENVPSNDPKINFGTGLPSFVLKKPFSEVVAGSITSDSAFPPLQHSKHSIPGSEKTNKQRVLMDRVEDKAHVSGNCQKSQITERLSSNESSHGVHIESDPFLQIGSNVIPVNVSEGGTLKANTSLKHVVVYVGFEHECPHGHRFFLSPEHLNELGSLYPLPEESPISSTESSDRSSTDLLKGSKIGLHEKMRKEQNHYYDGHSARIKCQKDLGRTLQCISLDDGGSAYSLLNRNLPIYMNCPHCRISRKKEDFRKIKFASTISQLQRIFLVTPPFPVVLSTSPVVQFDDSCLPPSVPDREHQSRFSLGCRVLLPPESFLALRLPFVYGVELEDNTLLPLNHLEHQPELTAWITKGSALQVVSKGSITDEDF